MLADVVRVLREVDPQSMTRRQLEDLIAQLSAVEAVSAERRLAAVLEGLGEVVAGLDPAAMLADLDDPAD